LVQGGGEKMFCEGIFKVQMGIQAKGMSGVSGKVHVPDRSDSHVKKTEQYLLKENAGP
jgi:hypothetical protein